MFDVDSSSCNRKIEFVSPIPFSRSTNVFTSCDEMIKSQYSKCKIYICSSHHREEGKSLSLSLLLLSFT